MGSASRPGRSLPPGKTRYPLYKRVGGPQGRSGQVRKISPPPGFDPRTVQPVVSRYTVYVTRPTILILSPSKSTGRSSDILTKILHTFKIYIACASTISSSLTFLDLTIPVSLNESNKLQSYCLFLILSPSSLNFLSHRPKHSHSTFQSTFLPKCERSHFTFTTAPKV